MKDVLFFVAGSMEIRTDLERLGSKVVCCLLGERDEETDPKSHVHNVESIGLLLRNDWTEQERTPLILWSFADHLRSPSTRVTP